MANDNIAIGGGAVTSAIYTAVMDIFEV